jgi:hypothetical protein
LIHLGARNSELSLKTPTGNVSELDEDELKGEKKHEATR